MSDEIILSDEDVVTVEKNSLFPSATPTSTVRELMQRVKSIIDGGAPMREEMALAWVYSGIVCKVLSIKSGGWQKGKIRIRFEFVPDEFIPDPTPTKTTIPPKTVSPLDDLRSQLNPE